MKYCVVTYIFNNYEILKDPLEVDPDCDYYCITDDSTLKDTDIYKIIYVKDLDTDKLTGVQKMVIAKYRFHLYIPNADQYDYFIRLDGSLLIYKSLRPIIDYLRKGKYDISIAPHYKRNNYVEEYNTWIAARNLNPAYYSQFLVAISDSSYNYKVAGLVETTLQIYRNCKEIYNFFDDLHATLGLYMNFEDSNEQCWFTFMLYKYFDKLRINYHHPTLYRYSDYMAVCNHGSLNLYHDRPVPFPEFYMFFNKPIRVNKIEDYTKSL